MTFIPSSLVSGIYFICVFERSKLVSKFKILYFFRTYKSIISNVFSNLLKLVKIFKVEPLLHNEKQRSNEKKEKALEMRTTKNVE